VKREELPLPITGERFRLEGAKDTVTVVRLADGRPVGRIDLESAADGLFVKALCIDEEHRSYGAGSEAAVLLNRACDAARAPVVRAWAPPDRGLAVYFWIRMGFRPLHGEGPDGGIWFERRLDEQTAVVQPASPRGTSAPGGPA